MLFQRSANLWNLCLRLKKKVLRKGRTLRRTCWGQQVLHSEEPPSLLKSTEQRTCLRVGVAVCACHHYCLILFFIYTFDIFSPCFSLASGWCIYGWHEAFSGFRVKPKKPGGSISGSQLCWQNGTNFTYDVKTSLICISHVQAGHTTAH